MTTDEGEDRSERSREVAITLLSLAAAAREGGRSAVRRQLRPSDFPVAGACGHEDWWEIETPDRTVSEDSPHLGHCHFSSASASYSKLFSINKRPDGRHRS